MLVGGGGALRKIPDGLTIRVTTNAREKTTKILAYRKGGFKRAYKATIPMCEDGKCRLGKPHSRVVKSGYRGYADLTQYHPRDVDTLVKGLIKSYS